MAALTATRLTWLWRRLGRMYWQEVPYRIGFLLRSHAQRLGLFTATEVPAQSIDATYGQGWCRVPDNAASADVALAALVEKTLRGQLSVFGKPVATRDGVPDWNRDPGTGEPIEPTFGLFIDFRHLGEGIDIKFLWEVNRHCWWVPLAQRFALTGDERCLGHIGKLLDSWLSDCPYPNGANWSSPVEHGIRLVNWSIVWTLIGGAESRLFGGAAGQALLQRWLASIYQHMAFADDNYSYYSSADNHLIGEATGVFVAAHTWDRWPESRRMRRKAKALLEREALRQFAPDGVNREQAVCYHKFAMQFLLASGLCARANGDDFSVAYWSRIEAAAVFLASMMDCRGRLPAIGDADDSEVWSLAQGAGANSYRTLVAAAAALFQRGDLQAKVEATGPVPDPQLRWLPLPAPPVADVAAMQGLPTRFDQGGYVLLGENLHRTEEFRAVLDCGALGHVRVAGHGHADALSVLVSWGGVDLLVDPGTYCYNAAPALRHYFRGTHAHNTLVVDGRDQSEYGASFLWLRDIETQVVHDEGAAVHALHRGYERLADPVVHHRRVTPHAGETALVVEDWIECARPHDVELLWHAAAGASLEPWGVGKWRLTAEGRAIELEISGAGLTTSIVAGRESPPQGWVSTRFYERTPAPVLSARARLAPHQVLRTRIGRGGVEREQAK